jgi:hypothetical protein
MGEDHLESAGNFLRRRHRRRGERSGEHLHRINFGPWTVGESQNLRARSQRRSYSFAARLTPGWKAERGGYLKRLGSLEGMWWTWRCRIRPRWFRPGRRGVNCRLMVRRLTVTVIYCPCDTILPLPGDGAAFSTPEEPQIRQHWSGSAAEASDAGRRREVGRHGGSSRKPA